jgi:hypothetical protein
MEPCGISCGISYEKPIEYPIEYPMDCRMEPFGIFYEILRNII